MLLQPDATVVGSRARARGGGEAAARERGRRGIQGRFWPDAAVVGEAYFDPLGTAYYLHLQRRWTAGLSQILV
jgi:hypothetical protein